MLLLKTGFCHVQVTFKTGFTVIIKVTLLPGLNKCKKLYNQTSEKELKFQYLKSLQQSTQVTDTGFLEQTVW
jgi:hypothetical protein